MRVPAQLEAEVLEADGRRCGIYVDGARCRATETLEVHYLIPTDKGGRPEPENALTICAGHLRGLVGAARRLHAHEVLAA